MKQLLFIAAAIIISGLTAFSLNRNTVVKSKTIKIEKSELVGNSFGTAKGDLSTAD